MLFVCLALPAKAVDFVTGKFAIQLTFIEVIILRICLVFTKFSFHPMFGFREQCTASTIPRIFKTFNNSYHKYGFICRTKEVDIGVVYIKILCL